MKTIYRYLMVFAAALALSACENAGDKVMLTNIGEDTEISLIASRNEVVITTQSTTSLALQLAWTIPDPQLTEFGVAEGVLSYKLEFSLDQNFATLTTVDASDASHSFTGGTLNAVMNRLPVQFDVANATYVRLAVYTGANMDPVYSNIRTISITPYEIDFTTMWIVDNNDTTLIIGSLNSPNSDGEYTGIVYMAAWRNGYFIAGDGTLYGSVANEDASNPFYLTTESSMWNFWFPGVSGYYYVQLSTNSMDWSALLLSGLSIIDADTETSLGSFSLADGVYTGVFQTTAASTGIYAAGTGQIYDKASGPESSGGDVPFWLSGSGSASSGELTFTTSLPAEHITVDGADTYTLKMNPAEMTYTISSGGEIPTVFPDQLYMWYKDDHSAYHTLLEQKASGVYGGYYNAQAWENFFLSDGADWGTATIYGCTDSSQAMVTTTAAEITDSFWALWFGETAGYYYVEIDLNTRTWTHTAAAFPEKLYMWYKEDHMAHHTELTQGEPGIYSGTYTAAAWENFFLTNGTNWGTATIYGCENDSQAIVTTTADELTSAIWSFWFGETAGTYTVTVNLTTGTWSYE